jgi:hypothetical protein
MRLCDGIGLTSKLSPIYSIRYWCIHGNCEEEAICFSPFTFPKVVTGWCEKHAPRVWVTRQELEKQIVVYEVMNT